MAKNNKGGVKNAQVDNSAEAQSSAVQMAAMLNFGEDEHLSVLTKPPQSEGLKTNFIVDTS